MRKGTELDLDALVVAFSAVGDARTHELLQVEGDLCCSMKIETWSYCTHPRLEDGHRVNQVDTTCC
jgi:hypothetical protein